jgi:hypothetical protein
VGTDALDRTWEATEVICVAHSRIRFLCWIEFLVDDNLFLAKRLWKQLSRSPQI